MIAYASSHTAACVAQGFLQLLNQTILYPLITLLLAVAFLWFLYGGALYIFNAAESGERDKGRKHMLYGVIGLLVMTSAFAILAIAANTFGVSPTGPECETAPGEGGFGAADFGADDPVIRREGEFGGGP